MVLVILAALLLLVPLLLLLRRSFLRLINTSFFVEDVYKSAELVSLDAGVHITSRKPTKQKIVVVEMADLEAFFVCSLVLMLSSGLSEASK